MTQPEIDLDDPTVFDGVRPRKTSSYKLAIEVGPAGDPDEIADMLKERCPVPVDTTGVTPDREAFIRFRASSPGQAVFIGRETTSIPFTLSTGYGVHMRPVDVG